MSRTEADTPMDFEVVLKMRNFSELQGRVVCIAPTVDVETRTTKVRVEVPNPGGRLKAGMYVTATLRVPLGKEQEVFYGC